MAASPTLLTREAKVGLFAIAIFGIMFWASFFIGKFDSALTGQTYYAVLESAHQLGVDSPVETAGIRVGRITKIEIIEGGRRAKVTFRVNGDVELYEDAEINVLTVGLLGDRYLNLVPGTVASGKLVEESTITRTTVPLAFEDLMDSFAPVVENVTQMTEDLARLLGHSAIQDGIPATVDSLRNTARQLEQMVSSYEDFVVAAVKGTRYINDRLPELMDALINQVGGADTVVSELASSVTETVRRIKRMSELFESSTEDLHAIISGIEAGEGTIGALLKDEETADDVREVVANLNDTLDRVTRLRTIVDYLGTYNYNNRSDGFRHRAEIRLQPSYDHYYSVGFVDRTEGKTSTRTRTISNGVSTYTEEIATTRDSLLFNAQIAKRFYDLTLRGGIIENDGGIGLDYAFWDDQLWLRTESYDFSRSGDNPRMRAWSELRIKNHLTIAVGVEDAISRQKRQQGLFGIGLYFTDEDLKYLFGSLPSMSF